MLIQKYVKICLGMLYKNDGFLLENMVHERSISHKLAEYLQDYFPDWNVDCEYNKKEKETKELDGIRECSEQKTTNRIYPDIIIHQRNVNHNLLVIEIKHGKIDTCDRKKLELLTSSNSDFKYKLGLFIGFKKTEKPILKWFENGQNKGSKI